MHSEIPNCFWDGPQSFNVQGFDTQAKINIFYQLTLVSNNFVLISYLSGIYLESCFYGLGGGVQKTLRRKQTKEKHLKLKKKKQKEYKKIK